MMSLPNERRGVDAGGALCLHTGRPRPGATHRDVGRKLKPFSAWRVFGDMKVRIGF